MTTHDRRTRIAPCGRCRQQGQAVSEWLMWAALMAALAAAMATVAMPVVKAVPAALGGWLASVAP